MNLELDHVFMLVEPEAQVADMLLTHGLRESPGNTHPGQGTANRRFYFPVEIFMGRCWRSPQNSPIR